MCKRNHFYFNMAKGFLHVAEQESSTRKGKRHETDILKDLMPFVGADPPLVGGWRKQIFESTSLVGGQAQSHVDCVHHPTNEHIAGRPWSVTCIKIFEGDDFLSLGGVQIVQGSEKSVQSMEKGTAHMVAPMGWALIQTKEFINKDIHTLQ